MCDLNLMFSIFQNYYPDFKRVRGKTLELLGIQASNIEQNTKVTDRVNLGGSVTSIVGGILAVVGAALTPVTFGASLGLTIAGLSVGGVGGVTSVGSVISDVKAKRAVKREKEKNTGKRHWGHKEVATFTEPIGGNLKKALEMVERSTIRQSHTTRVSSKYTHICWHVGVCVQWIWKN